MKRVRERAYRGSIRIDFDRRQRANGTSKSATLGRQRRRAAVRSTSLVVDLGVVLLAFLRAFTSTKSPRAFSAGLSMPLRPETYMCPHVDDLLDDEGEVRERRPSPVRPACRGSPWRLAARPRRRRNGRHTLLATRVDCFSSQVYSRYTTRVGV